MTAADHPEFASPVLRTGAGTPYLRSPGVALLARPAVSLAGMAAFLNGFEGDLGFSAYLSDETELAPGAAICKAAGQLCYMSFGPKRTKNADAGRYLANIKESGHGSVLEHAAYSILLYGISRSVTHELVRHRAGFAFSQVSQRYVSGRVLRFVERPEFAAEADLHAEFELRIDRAAAEYARVAAKLLTLQQDGGAMLSGEARTDLRKKVQQAARAVLPNETEAPIVVTANARAWRHFIEMRANRHAELEIRRLALLVYRVLFQAEPMLFEDYRVVDCPDGTPAVETDFAKV
ncbi:MAG: FAD-dependent thymidylate synthase [Armatimonadetes bacterium]|nr:FAD-dependent thymidylate synthase [Armatimonadota bacterium]MDE2207614.1 FAD-dependent thymidylate synthase [Armatimonadota bacterium]